LLKVVDEAKATTTGQN